MAAALHHPPLQSPSSGSPPRLYPALQDYDDDDPEDPFLHPPPLYPAVPQYDFDEADYAVAGDLIEQYKSLDLEYGSVDRMLEDMAEEVRKLECEVQYLTELTELGMRRAQITPLVTGNVVEVIDETHAVVTTSAGPRIFCVPILSTVDRELLKPSANVALSWSSLAIVDVLPTDAGRSVPVIAAGSEKPSVTYADVAGCDEQKQELLEVVELPLTHPELFARIGLEPPRCVLLHGPPGTGKTMLAKAVAHHTSAAFIHVSGAQLVHRLPGEGPRMVREVFQAARDNAPAIVFFDEVDAIATARTDSASGADREVHRVLMELLAQMDGFDQSTNVRVIMATNRADALDPALLRPGRLDRRIEFPVPGRRQKRLVFQACTAGMSLDGDVDLEDLVARHDEISAAEVDAVCREAGMRAVRKNRCVVTREDFDEGYRAVVKNIDRGANDFPFYN